MICVKAYNAAVNETTLSHFDLLEELPSCQLQIKCGTGQPSKGGYLSSFDTVYEVTMTSQYSQSVPIIPTILLSMHITFQMTKYF